MVRNDSLIVTTEYSVRREVLSEGVPTVPVVWYDRPLQPGPSMIPAEKQILRQEGSDFLGLISSCNDCYGAWRFVPSR